MVTVRHERPDDGAARDALLDVAYGPVRFTKASERLREGRLPELALVANDTRADEPAFGECPARELNESPRWPLASLASAAGRVVGTVRLWRVSAGRERPVLLLGPLAVHPSCRNRGIGGRLVQQALREAAQRGHGAVLLVGDTSYYGRFGFSAEKTGALWLPGPYQRHRLLARELAPGTLDGAHGLIGACGPLAPKPDLAALVAGLARNNNAPARTIERPRRPLASHARAISAA
jgi:predicted N-acetyltransferase YhbS